MIQLGSTTKLLNMMFYVMFLFISSSALADSRKDFNQGVSLFKAEKYQEALVKFKQAEKQGLKSSSLYYNLASSYYKTEQYNDSKKYFEKVKKTKKLRSVADYNLGLIAVKQGNKTLARKLFASVSATSKDNKLAVLSNKKLSELNSKAKKWRAFISLAYGDDDNVNFSPLGVSANRSDNYLELYTSADYFISGNRTNGWRAEVSYFDIDYSTVNNADENELGFGIKKYSKISELWSNQYDFNYVKLNYGGQDYQTILKFGMVGKKKLSKNERLLFKYHYEDISSELSLYNYLAGWRQKGRVEYRQYAKNNIQKLYYELELNNRADLANASYSPTRHTIRGKYTHIYNRDWRLTGDLAYRKSIYPDQGTQSRDDNRFNAKAYLDYYFTKKTKLRSKLTYTDNNSSESRFTYKRTVLSVGIEHSF